MSLILEEISSGVVCSQMRLHQAGKQMAAGILLSIEGVVAWSEEKVLEHCLTTLRLFIFEELSSTQYWDPGLPVQEAEWLTTALKGIGLNIRDNRVYAMSLTSLHWTGTGTVIIKADTVKSYHHPKGTSLWTMKAEREVHRNVVSSLAYFPGKFDTEASRPSDSFHTGCDCILAGLAHQIGRCEGISSHFPWEFALNTSTSSCTQSMSDCKSHVLAQVSVRKLTGMGHSSFFVS